MHEFTSQELNAILQATKKYEEAGPAKMHFLWPFFFVQKIGWSRIIRFVHNENSLFQADPHAHYGASLETLPVRD